MAVLLFLGEFSAEIRLMMGFEVSQVIWRGKKLLCDKGVVKIILYFTRSFTESVEGSLYC